jgi:hypothetical protein
MVHAPVLNHTLGKALDELGNTPARLPLARIFFRTAIEYA